MSIYEKKAILSKELLAFMYGSLVVRLTKDIEDPIEINKKVEEIGYNIGKRLIDEIIDVLGKDVDTLNQDLVSKLMKILFKNYLGINLEIKQFNEKEQGIIFPENPFNSFVELPDKLKDLWYSNIFCGIIRGLLEAANIQVECTYVKDKLRGDDTNEIKIKIIQFIEYLLKALLRYTLILILPNALNNIKYCFPLKSE